MTEQEKAEMDMEMAELSIEMRKMVRARRYADQAMGRMGWDVSDRLLEIYRKLQ